MPRFSLNTDGGAVVGLTETVTIATDASGGFIYGFTEQYTTPPNVQAQPLAAGSPVPIASQAVGGSLTPTVGTIVITAATVGGVSYPKGYVSGKVFGAAPLTIAGIGLIGLSTLTASVNVQLMVLGS